MKVFSYPLLLGALAIGCNPRSPATPDAVPVIDAPAASDARPAIDASPDAALAIITLQTDEPPPLVAFRNESSTEWQNLTAPGTSRFEIRPTGPFRLAIACEVRDPVFTLVIVTELARTPGDGALIEHVCASAPPPFVVRGVVAQAGEVSLGDFFGAGSVPNWPLEIQAFAGTFDLVMMLGDFFDGFEQIAIFRGLTITGDTDLRRLDAAKVGAEPLVRTSFMGLNLDPREIQSSSAFLDVGNTFALLASSSDWDVRFAPDSVLRPEDRQRVTLRAEIQSSTDGVVQRLRRSVGREFRVGDSTAVTLPEPLGPVTFEMTPLRLVARWSSLPPHDRLALSRQSFGATGTRLTSHDLVLSRSFVEAVQPSSATIDFERVPGFKSDWRIDTTVPQTRVFSANRNPMPRSSESSLVTERIPAPPPAGVAAPGAVVPRALARRLRALGRGLDGLPL